MLIGDNSVGQESKKRLWRRTKVKLAVGVFALAVGVGTVGIPQLLPAESVQSVYAAVETVHVATAEKNWRRHLRMRK